MENKRKEVAAVRLNSVERQALEELSRREYFSISEALRFCLRETLAARRLWPPELKGKQP